MIFVNVVLADSSENLSLMLFFYVFLPLFIPKSIESPVLVLPLCWQLFSWWADFQLVHIPFYTSIFRIHIYSFNSYLCFVSILVVILLI